MPVHDWSRVEAGIFHHFHQCWIIAISEALNGGLLPPDHYAMAEQFAGKIGPDVVTLNGPAADDDDAAGRSETTNLITSPPRVRMRARTEMDRHAAKAKAVVVRHVSGHHVVAVVEIVSPGNKSSRAALRTFVDKAVGLIRASVNLLIIDLFPPSRRDPEGVHKAIWDEFTENDFALPKDESLTLASYAASESPEAFIEPTAVGATLVDMPLFLHSDGYVSLPTETTYRTAWERVPAFWRKVVEGDKAL
jgi:hypothetical protein